MDQYLTNDYGTVFRCMVGPLAARVGCGGDGDRQQGQASSAPRGAERLTEE